MPEKNKRQQRLNNGYCGTCGVNKINEFSTCDTCKEKSRLYQKQRLIERKKYGLCTTCGKNYPVLKMKTCQQCRDEHIEKWIKNGERYKKIISYLVKN